MVVTYYGEGCFRLQSGETSLLVDPHNPRLKADVVLRTVTPTADVQSQPTEISFPGEYEIKGLEINGWPILAELSEKTLKTVYLVRWEDITFAFLGHLSVMPEGELLERMGEPDVLFLPTDGDRFLSAEQVSKIVKNLEPHLVVPSFSKDPEALVKIFGQKVEPQGKLVFKRKELEDQRMKIVVLESGA